MIPIFKFWELCFSSQNPEDKIVNRGDWESSELGFFGIPIIGHAKLVCPKNPFSKLVSGGKLFAANIISIMSTNNKKPVSHSDFQILKFQICL